MTDQDHWDWATSDPGHQRTVHYILGVFDFRDSATSSNTPQWERVLMRKTLVERGLLLKKEVAGVSYHVHVITEAGTRLLDMLEVSAALLTA